MAKSMRSKRMRRNRAVKRAKNGVKELAKLREVLALDKTGQEDFPMKDLVQVTASKAVAASEQNSEGTTNASNEGEMDVDPKYNRKNFKDENGQYPAWMNQRMMRKQKSKNVKRIKSKNKKSSNKK